ncbi:hypothetical protein LCGC14_1686280, partial [marine sediment metagenome]
MAVTISPQKRIVSIAPGSRTITINTQPRTVTVGTVLSGETNTGFNVGGGTGLIFLDKTGALLNFRTLVGVSGVAITVVGDTVEVSTSGTAGDFVGPANSTDKAIVRFDGTTGKLGQNSNVTIDDTGNITLPAFATVDGRDVSVDGTKLDGVESGATADQTITAGAGLTGGGAGDVALDVVANADGSIVVNANDVQVGVLATDAQHGVRGGGTQHSVVIAAGAAGFMSSADKTKLDAVVAVGDVIGPAGATNEAFARFNTVTGKLIQDSVVTSTDLGVTTIPSGGSLGIGAAPAAPFHVTEPTVSLVGRFTKTNSGSIFVRIENTTRAWNIGLNSSEFFQVADATSGNDPFQIEPGAADNLLYLVADRVGVNESNPQNTLEVASG